MPEHLHACMSPALRCSVAPLCDTDDDMLRAFMHAEPLLPPAACARRVAAETGPDVFEYVQQPAWNAFPRPRLAMIGGWGAPGTPVLGDDHVTLVHSFTEILTSAEPVNLQMFHRDGEGEPRLPKLPELLDWPLQDLLDGEDGGWGVCCDIATRISRRNAVTWWHLDDGGEFVLQVAAPIPGTRLQAPVLLGPSGKPVVKLFIFATKHHYDFITQDEVMNATRKFSHMHLFETPTEHLPDQSGDGASDVLPQFWVAPLEAGGRPLLSPANLPHVVITLQDCVMVEMRKIFHLCIDEVAHFMRRAALWQEPPIMYPFITSTLRDTGQTAAIAQRLIAEMDARGGGVAGATQKLTPHMKACRYSRAFHSLEALAGCSAFSIGEHVRSDIAAALERHRSSVPPDPRAAIEAACRRGLQNRVKGVTMFSSPRERGEECYAAYVHVEGRPRWGPVRTALQDARQDRKQLMAARRSGQLDACLASLHSARPRAR